MPGSHTFLDELVENKLCVGDLTRSHRAFRKWCSIDKNSLKLWIHWPHNFGIAISSIQVNIAMEWIPEDLVGGKSALVQIIWHQAMTWTNVDIDLCCHIGSVKHYEFSHHIHFIGYDVLQCPIDMRRCMAENVVLMGGTAMLPGFRHRLQQELIALLKSPKYEEKLPGARILFHTPPARENYVAWLGGQYRLVMSH